MFQSGGQKRNGLRSCNYRELQPVVHPSRAPETAWCDESLAGDKSPDVSEFLRSFGKLLSFGEENASLTFGRSQPHANGDDDLCSPSRYCGISRYAYARDAVCRDRSAYCLGENQRRARARPPELTARRRPDDPIVDPAN